MLRPQFSIRTLLWLTLVVAAFLGGILFEKERYRRSDEYYEQPRRPFRGPFELFDPNAPISGESA
jgi:hypothetical protein